MSIRLSSRRDKRGQYGSAACRKDTYAQGGWDNQRFQMKNEQADAENSWIAQSDENAWAISGSWNETQPKSERLQYVDVLSDIIPFWLREVAAAERGETLRYDQFLERLQAEREKRFRMSDWGLPVPDWAEESHGQRVKKSSDTDRSNHLGGFESSMRGGSDIGNPIGKESSETSLDRDDFNFVEKVARLNDISPSRKKEMQRFYKVSTDEKVKRIEVLIDSLRGH